MREIKNVGICIKSIDYGEYDKIVTLFLTEVGRVTAKLKSVRKPKAKLKFAASPFCVGEYMLHKNSNGYMTVLGCDLINSHQKLWKNLEGVYFASVLMELLDKFTVEGEQDDDLLDVVIECLNELNVSVDIAILDRYMGLFISRIGYGINVDNIVNGEEDYAYLTPLEGGLTKGMGAKKLSRDECVDLQILVDNGLVFHSPCKLFENLVYYIENLAEIRLKTAKDLILLLNSL